MNNKIKDLDSTTSNTSQSSDTEQVSELSLFLDSIKPELKSKTQVVILQHPQEKKEELATVALLQRIMPNVIVKVGLSWPSLRKILDKEVDLSRWGVIYLGTQAESEKLASEGKKVSLIGKAKKTSELEGIIALDGSWREAKTLWWRNAWLLKLNRIVLNPEKPAIYNALKKEPRRESVSTLEAIALVLSEIEKSPEIYSTLVKPLEEFVSKPEFKKIKNQRPKKDWRKRKGNRNFFRRKS